MEQNEILDFTSRIVTDKEFRNWFVSNPKEALATLGLSKTAFDVLVRVAPIVVAVAISGVLADLPPDPVPDIGYRDR